MSKNRLILEVDDSIKDNAVKQTGGAQKELRPLETPFQEESQSSPRIGVNPHYRPGLVSPKDPNRFDRDRLFSAVTRGSPEELDGLGDYLKRTCKFLTNSEYTDGKTGKTCLMKALLNLKDGKNETIALLLSIDSQTENPRPLVNAACIDSYYRGHAALHIAIEKRNLDLVKLLVGNGADVHAKACGEFFQQKKNGVCFYFGELPLSLAACTNQLEVVRYLVNNPYQQARLTEQDSLGNSVLHALIMVANDTKKNTELVIEMYDQILMVGSQVNPTWHLEEIVNRQGLTPLKLAAKTGKVEIFKHILNREMKDPAFRHLSRKFTEWTYGPICISLYDLSSIDSYEKNSVLEILAYNSDAPNRYKMVVLEPLNKLLQYKWDSFAARRFYLSFSSYIIFMAVFTTVAYHRPLEGKPPFPVTLAPGNLLRFVGQIVVLSGGFYLLIAQGVYLWRRRQSLGSLLADGCIELFLLLQSVLLLLSALIYLAGLEEYVPLMVSSLLLGWVNMLYYTRGFQQIGIYSVMIQKTIFRDLVRFLLVYAIFLFGFATALIILTGEPPLAALNRSVMPVDEKEARVAYKGLLTTSLELFKFTIGMGDLEFNEHMQFKYFVMFVLLLFVVLTYILLLNMLIALMSETVISLSGDSLSVWKLQRAVAILEIEKNWLWFWKKAPRSGCLLSVGSEEKQDERWFFRVEEINWAIWTKKLRVLKEDPVSASNSEMELSEKSLWNWLSRMRARLSMVEEEESQLPLHPLRHSAK